jgi:hypothetical protein
MTADQGGEDVDGGGLAGAIAAEEAEDGALLDRQADPADRRYRAEALGQAFGDYRVRHGCSVRWSADTRRRRC